MVSTPDGRKLGVLNLEGRVFMKALDDPFRCADEEIAKRMRSVTLRIFVDMHCETTSEKNAMGAYLDGRVSAVVGSHTHVQTADERILPGGTAYLTDAGMCGPLDSVIGVKKELALQRFLTQRYAAFETATPRGEELRRGPGSRSTTRRARGSRSSGCGRGCRIDGPRAAGCRLTPARTPELLARTRASLAVLTSGA